MPNETVVILGIPIDNVTMEQAVEQIFEMIDTFPKDRLPNLVATVNVDFLVNTLSWFSRRPRHPELLNILRQANLVTADGMPLVWISRLLGATLKERVTGADLVPRLAKEASLRGKSIYFLGGTADAGQKAAELLKKHYPELLVAGADAPFVSIVGRELADAREKDHQIVDRINRSKTDILLVAFGNPKQEVWFERNRTFLQVPVTIGIGGTFEFITGSVARAPKWMQKTGLEWIFRITQDPKRLLKRYFVGFFKFGLMTLPVLIYFSYRRFLFKLTSAGSKKSSLLQAGSTGTVTTHLINVDDPLDAAMVERINREINDISFSGAGLIIDLTQVNFIDSCGIGFLLKCYNKIKKENKKIHLVGLKSSVERTLKLSRIYDLFTGCILATQQEALNALADDKDSLEFQMILTQTSECLLIRFSGVLDASKVSGVDLETVLDNLHRRHCALDLSELSFVDSSGLMIFLKLHRHVTRNERTCWVSGAAGPVKQMFKITRIDRLFKMVPDVNAIVAGLEKN